MNTMATSGTGCELFRLNASEETLNAHATMAKRILLRIGTLQPAAAQSSTTVSVVKRFASEGFLAAQVRRSTPPTLQREGCFRG